MTAEHSVVARDSFDRRAFKIADNSRSTSHRHRNRRLYTALMLLVLVIATGTLTLCRPVPPAVRAKAYVSRGSSSDSGGTSVGGRTGRARRGQRRDRHRDEAQAELGPYAFGVLLVITKLLLAAGIAVIGMLALKAGAIAGQKLDNQVALIMTAIAQRYSQHARTRILDNCSKKLVAEPKPSTADAATD